MSVHIVRLGSPRRPQEGLRIGSVRRPPRGVPKTEYATGNWYDVWLPQLAPSAELLRTARPGADEAEWRRFARAYRKEMAQPDSARLLDLLAALSHQSNFSLGCYCAQEAHCHRSILRELLLERHASVA